MQGRRIILAIALALLPAAAAHAQEPVVVRVGTSPSTGWLGFSYGAGRWMSDEAVVVDTVIPESPAARAGLQKGDTIAQVNGLRATQQLLRSLALEPGDEVELRVRRSAAERTLRLVAAERPADYEAVGNGAWSIRLDSIGPRILERVRMQLDSIDFPDVYVQSFPDSGGRMMMIRRQGDVVDTLRFGFDADSMARTFRLFGDSMRIFSEDMRQAWDSVFVRMGSPEMRFSFSDSVVIINGDTVEAGMRRFRGPDGAAFAWTMPRVARVGFNSIAGMELEELSPRLGAYFGADHGLLVLAVAPETPAARAGLQDGDVIVRAAGEEVASVPALRHVIGRVRPGDPERDVELEILRERRTMKRTLRLESGRVR